MKEGRARMAYKLFDTAQQRWRRRDGHELVSDVLDGVKFKDGVKALDATTTNRTRGKPPDHSSCRIHNI